MVAEQFPRQPEFPQPTHTIPFPLLHILLSECWLPETPHKHLCAADQKNGQGIQISNSYVFKLTLVKLYVHENFILHSWGFWGCFGFSPWEDCLSSCFHCHIYNRGPSCFLFNNGQRKKTNKPTNLLSIYQLWGDPSSLGKFWVSYASIIILKGKAEAKKPYMSTNLIIH